MALSLLKPASAGAVIFSERARAAIVAETFEQHPNETGGILLGHCLEGVWHVIEAIDPGPAARFSPVTFEYDTAYVNHLARKVAGSYERPLRLIGLWHRHPGSNDRFSEEDDLTNRRYAVQCPDGAISCLVNLDPLFRISAYHVPHDLRYRRLPHQCGNGAIPAELLELRRSHCLQPDVLEDRRQQRCLERLLVCTAEPALAGPMPPVLAALMEFLLELLDGQRRFAYALRACGPQLVIGLVERQGRGQHRLQLDVAGSGDALIQADGAGEAWPFDAERFRRFLAGAARG